jgi:hypothetical protein
MKTKTHLIKSLGSTALAVTLLLAGAGTCLAESFSQIGEPTNDGGILYMPNNYTAEPGESNTIEVIVGEAGFPSNEWIRTFEAVVNFDPDHIEFDSEPFDFSGTPLEGHISSTQVNINDDGDQLAIGFVLNSGEAQQLNVDDVVFRLKASIPAEVNPGTDIVLRINNILIGYQSTPDGPVLESSVTTISSGKIIIPGGIQCAGVDCGDGGACNVVTGQCVCYTGYEGVDCGQCSQGYLKSPDGSCQLDILYALESIILTFDKETIGRLSTDEKAEAYTSAYLMLNSLDAEGAILNVEGMPLTVPAPDGALDCNAAPVDCLNDMTNGLKNLIQGLAGQPVAVERLATTPGLLKLNSTSGNTDGSLVGIDTTSGAIQIYPGLEYDIFLHPSDSYRLITVGKFDDGSAIQLNYNQVEWMPQPMNRLNNSALNGGLLEKGDAPGKGPLYVQVKKSTGQTISSNQIVVDVPAGAIIEYLRLMGAGSIVRGDRVTLNIKVSDVEGIGDISDMRTNLVRSGGSSYQEISEDPSAVWFTATPAMGDAVVADTGTDAGLAFIVLNLPVEIPQDAALVDGPYKLILQLTDSAGRVTNSILSVTLGEKATGDVNADGKINMLDVLISFRIANGSLSATPAMKTSADLNADGKVTMIDVLLLFRQLN